MKYIVGNAGTFTIAEHDTSSGAIDPDASSARGALTVAASNHATPATPEGFSSRGPAFKLFDVAGNRLAAPENRNKPDLAAADGVVHERRRASTRSSGRAPRRRARRASPRSCCSARPCADPDQLARDPQGRRATRSTARARIGLPERRLRVRVRARRRRGPRGGSTRRRRPWPRRQPGRARTAPNGWFTTPSVGVDVDGVRSRVPCCCRESGCEPRSVAADTTDATPCVATSLGGTTTQSVTIKHDASPPSPPAFTGITAQQLHGRAAPGRRRDRVHVERPDVRRRRAAPSPATARRSARTR